MARNWPRIRAVLDAEVFHRARRFAEDGAAGLLNDRLVVTHRQGRSLLSSRTAVAVALLGASA
ncbi:hypothetical protein [Micromonospora sp. NPDC005299]|uniref:hypothetical protein n=1 Tax=Micromonospora sp. NPDC005299 TaxID=3364231 RepID=UPI0036B56878